MKVSFVLLPTLLALSTSAVTFDVPRLPTPIFADREASSDADIPPRAYRDLRSFRMQLFFEDVMVRFLTDGTLVIIN